MKLEVKSYKVKTRRRSWLACQENRAEFETVTETRWRIECRKKVLEDGFHSEALAIQALDERWSYEGMEREYIRARNEMHEKIQVANEKFSQDIADLNKRLKALRRVEKSVTRCR